MAYESIDALQNVLARDVFHYTRDSKKAAGRALGTLVEIINFYLLKAWGHERRTAIERRIPEYANSDLTHNVEFTLHPAHNIATIELEESELPFTPRKIRRKIGKDSWDLKNIKNTQLLSRTRLLRNSCTIYESEEELAIAYLGNRTGDGWEISVQGFHIHPFALFECKRVGVEEGMKKGPQTIEKAKQGAYVARSVSSLQKIRKADGSVYGVLPMPNNGLEIKPYDEFIQAIVNSEDQDLLSRFILTVGIVSNHGNWFTSDDHNKELRVLAQSYDWLLFLTDAGLVRFIEDLLLEPHGDYRGAREAFLNSYSGARGKNRFTKVTIHLEADKAIQRYFEEHLAEIEGWFNIVSPVDMSIGGLKSELNALANKDWETILK